MDLMLNAVEDDASGGENSPSPAPPAFAMPVSRISSRGGASLSSILSAASPQTPNDAPPFELPVARHAGLASLMNSPRDIDRGDIRDEAMNFERGGVVVLGDEPRADVVPHVAVMDGSQEKELDVVSRETPGDKDEAEEDGEEDEEMEEDVVENDESPVKQGRRNSIVSEASVSTPPPMATTVQSPASVAVNADALVLEDAELVELKAALQTAIQKYLTAEAKANAPPAKRRKGKQPQKKRLSQAASQADASTAVTESLEAVGICITKVHDKITMELMEIAVLRDVVRMCVMFLGIVNGIGPVLRAPTLDLKTALKALQRKPVHLQLASTIRRVMLSVPEDAVPLILADVLDWILSSGTEIATWGWVFLFFAQFDSSAIIDFFVRHAVFQQPIAHGGQETQLTLVVLESLAPNRTTEIVEAVRRALQQIATGSDTPNVPVADAMNRLVSLGMQSPTLLHAVDDSFQWIFTRDLVLALWQKSLEDGARPILNGAGEQNERAVYLNLLRLIDERSVDLDNTIFQLVLLIQQLSAIDRANSPSDMVGLAGTFQTDVVRVAQNQSSTIILRSVHRRLPYVSQICIELLNQDQEPADTGLPASRLKSWKCWLVAIAASISRRDITDRLLQADLTACELASSSDSSAVPVESVCELLCSIVEPSSQEFVVLLREIASWLRHLVVSSIGRSRLLSILELLVEKSTDTHASELKLVPLQIEGLNPSNDVIALINAFGHMSPCQESWTQLEQWRAASGAEMWEYLLDLVIDANQDNAEISIHALLLLAKTPFPSLEDPLWQFRCIRKLTNVYFYTLRRYRGSMIDLEASHETRRECLQHLETMRSIIDRVCSLDGAVAHYPSSVCSQFTSLWLDLLFSTAAATSVPTHFPSSTKGNSLALRKPTSAMSGGRRDNLTTRDDQVVIRSERTISSKCTNLQSSQVITKHSETLIFRKALDETWERELHAAFTCSVLATNVLAQLVQVRSPDVDEDMCERRMKVLVDMLLERATPCCGVPSDDVYKEILPNRSSFDMDLRIEQWINHFPAFLPLLRIVIDHCTSSLASTQSLRLVPIIKSALAVLVGHWNSVKGELDHENMDVPPYMRNRNQLTLSCELLRIIRASGWLPEPLARTAELLPLTTPADTRAILFSCWFFLADHPPSATSTTQSQGSASASATPAKMPIEFYVLPVRKALHRNIHKVGAKYASFMC